MGFVRSLAVKPVIYRLISEKKFLTKMFVQVAAFRPNTAVVVVYETHWGVIGPLIEW